MMIHPGQFAAMFGDRCSTGELFGKFCSREGNPSAASLMVRSVKLAVVLLTWLSLSKPILHLSSYPAQRNVTERSFLRSNRETIDENRKTAG
jgi:hypothetical protein